MKVTLADVRNEAIFNIGMMVLFLLVVAALWIGALGMIDVRDLGWPLAAVIYILKALPLGLILIFSTFVTYLVSQDYRLLKEGVIKSKPALLVEGATIGSKGVIFAVDQLKVLYPNDPETQLRWLKNLKDRVERLRRSLSKSEGAVYLRERFHELVVSLSDTSIRKTGW